MQFRPELVELYRKEVVGSRFVVGGTTLGILLFWNLRDQPEQRFADPDCHGQGPDIGKDQLTRDE
jgi:hypothetical protein